MGLSHPTRSPVVYVLLITSLNESIIHHCYKWERILLLLL
jgi:hypothetical protein